MDKNLIEIIQEEFSEYKIGLNTPYSGSLVPMKYWQKDNRVKSVMIEINKRIYTKTDNITKSGNFITIKNKIDKILNKII
jgi:N-formylglutamate amidohydrolase